MHFYLIFLLNVPQRGEKDDMIRLRLKQYQIEINISAACSEWTSLMQSFRSRLFLPPHHFHLVAQVNQSWTYPRPPRGRPDVALKSGRCRPKASTKHHDAPRKAKTCALFVFVNMWIDVVVI